MPKTGRAATVAAVEAGCLDLADLLDDLAADEWAVRSLCGGWTVREVVAHLTIATRWTVRSAVRGVLRTRGDLDRHFDEVAPGRAAEFGPAELVEQLRATASSTLRFPRRVRARPARRRPGARAGHRVPARAGADDAGRARGAGAGHDQEQPVLRREDASRRRPAGRDRRRPGGGEGPELRGPAGDLLLVATGRPVGPDALTGPGAAVVAGRMAGRPDPGLATA
ncbi:maleylpyruvate isomerase family mycothiol-dependent enzyme [Pseudonocardia abyssalis]|jgi:uncharacterized protein (TIGR03083 family)|uniref:maleylpyruvate isomerase family mycothiol-dependent enzyme n=1 Tax=Pseudonocardia abyssalis TaxID=2792008 RepID=UPI001C4A3D9C|nr:maleylpyruvate isomerase family mycothiol-dependent enzyme [Pseudonocardia abyssalis]